MPLVTNQTYRELSNPKHAISIKIMPLVSGNLLDKFVLFIINTVAKQIIENSKTVCQLLFGFFHKLIEGIIPFFSNVNLNHATYIRHRPINPRIPLVKDLESQGPEGAKSNSV